MTGLPADALPYRDCVGAALFTWIGQITGMYKEGEYAGFFGAVIGSLIVLGIWRMVAKMSRAFGPARPALVTSMFAIRAQ